MRLLIVDDAKLNILSAKQVIENAEISCEILSCMTGEEVFNILQETKIDIILLDIILPHQTGLDVLKKIKANPNYEEIQVIMYTSLTDKSYLEKSFYLGAVDFVNKPIDQTEFVARIKSVIRLKSTLDLLKEKNQSLIQINKQLNQTKFQLVQKEKLSSIGQLAAGVAHEINNPIGYISSNVETLEKYLAVFISLITQYYELVKLVEDPEQTVDNIVLKIHKIYDLAKKKKLDFILDDIEDLMNETKSGLHKVKDIVLSLRNFARPVKQDEFGYHDLNEIIEETLFIIHNEAKYFIDVKKEYGETFPIFCNRGQISQVMLNVLINAVQAIKEQKREDRGQIFIKTYIIDRDILCEIEDDGPGIPKDVENHIFDPFFTTKDVGVGTGLGLSISYDIIVNKHKGDIFFKSKEGKGTRFIIKLPINHAMESKGDEVNGKEDFIG